MPRNKEGLHSRQAALLRYDLDNRCTMDQALAARKVKPSLFQKWYEQPDFKKAFEKRRALRAVLAEKTPTVESQTPQTPPTDDPAPSPSQTPSPATSSAACGLTGPRPSQPKPAQPQDPPMTEREWVHSLNGDAGVKAYDEFVALKRRLALSHADQPPPDNGASAPDGNDQSNSNGY
jgi:hypothetical protein